MEQLTLLPKLIKSPTQRKVPLSELPENIPGEVPKTDFIESVRTAGILQPVILIESAKGYQIAAGRRRIKAAREVGLISVPAYIFQEGYMSGDAIALIENKQRNKSEISDFIAIRNLANQKLSAEDIAKQLGVSVSEINKYTQLLRLNSKLQEGFVEGKVKLSTARSMSELGETDQAKLVELLEKNGKIKGKDVKSLSNPGNNQLPVDWRSQSRELAQKMLDMVPEKYHAKVTELIDLLDTRSDEEE